MLKQASTNKVRLLDLLMITIGCGIYALGFVKINIANRLAEGGVTGISLIIYHLFHVDPSISTFCINIPLIVIGYRLLGRRALIYTVYGPFGYQYGSGFGSASHSPWIFSMTCLFLGS